MTVQVFQQKLHSKIETMDDDNVTKKLIRRKDVASYLYSLWTINGSDLSCLAPLLVDGTTDIISEYVLGIDDDKSLFPNGNDNNDTFDVTKDNDYIDRIHCTELSYEDFVTLYMECNKPVIITGIADNWTATRKWVNYNDGTPNVDYLQEQFASSIAPVVEQESSGFELSRSKNPALKMSISEYVTWWKLYHEVDRNEKNSAVVSTDRKENDNNVPLLYLKDWKFLAAYPNYNAYEWPQYFSDDWLNDAMGNAYKFVYLGPAGTSTPLHADVLRSYSWSTNICGIKKWILVPPTLTNYLYDCIVFGGTTLPTYIDIDLDYPGMKSFYPGLEYVRQHCIEVVQQPGETIFVPSNWFHTVINIRPTLSINHNWVNGYNIRKCWDQIESEIRSLRQRIVNQSIGHVDSENSAEIGLHTCNDASENCNDQMGHVDDDALLLWHIVSKKANIVLNGKKLSKISGSSDKDQCRIDCDAILHVLCGLQHVIEEQLLSSTQFAEQINLIGINDLYEKIIQCSQ